MGIPFRKAISPKKFTELTSNQQAMRTPFILFRFIVAELFHCTTTDALHEIPLVDRFAVIETYSTKITYTFQR